MTTRDLADIAADKLDRLAEDLEALAGIDLSAAPALVRQQAESTLRDSRVQAAGALERLAASMPAVSARHARAEAQVVLGKSVLIATPGLLRDWSRAYRAFADAPEP